MSGHPAWTYTPYKVLWVGLDLLFPPNCAGCGKPGARWCDDCQKALVLIPSPICDVCGTPQKKDGICPACLIARPPFYSLRSWAVFDKPIREALHRLKYRRDIGLGDALSNHLVPFMKTLNWDVDMVVPVPLSNQRYKERGYNQIALVAHPFSLQMRLVYSSKVLARKKHTISQVGLSATERKKNVEGAFWADAKLTTGKSILLMDDVATTGSTIAAAASALTEAGASRVYALTLARALSHHGLDNV